jgi:hypothetical protein
MSASAQRASWVIKENCRNMKSQTNKFPCLLLLIAGTAVFLLSGAGIARILGWNPIAPGGTGEILSRDSLSAIKVRAQNAA